MGSGVSTGLLEKGYNQELNVNVILKCILVYRQNIQWL